MKKNDSNAILISKVEVCAYIIPTDFPEADGTISWNETTLIIVKVEAGNHVGIGYTYGSASVASYIQRHLSPLIIGLDGLSIPFIHKILLKSIRNDGSNGVPMMAVSAIDTAIWDLKGKVLNLPLFRLLGKVRDAIKIYGSGGFTSYSIQQLQTQLSEWAKDGMKSVKMKIGAEPENDVRRVRAASEVIGTDTSLFVDANGAYDIKTAIDKAYAFADMGVTWFEEPIPSPDLKGLNFIRHKLPAGMNLAAGEYGNAPYYFFQMIQAGAIDVLQADATRCGGISGFLKAGHICEAAFLPFSSHCAPSLHLHAAMSLPAFHIAEYFHDHVRIEKMLFDGFPRLVDGHLYPDCSKPGIGLDFKFADAEKYKII